LYSACVAVMSAPTHSTTHTCSFTKLLYVCGQPLGLPKIETPTQADIDQWHAKYCAEVSRLFHQYKERVPEYKHKKLEIV
jgi:hypothetical protein